MSADPERPPQASMNAPAPDAPARTFAVLAGGGTAGHVLPALAVADALVAAGHDRASIHFVGAERGMEATMVPAAGYGVTLLRVEGVQRRLTPANARAAARFSRAVPQTLNLLHRMRPRVVVSVGGYASVPAVVAAATLRIPVVAVSYDAVPGAASRLAARVATATAVAFASSPLPRAVVTGAPLRDEILGLDRERDRDEARAALGLPRDRFVVLVFGGSLGSGKLNDVTAAYVDTVAGRGDLAVHHVVGRRAVELPERAVRPDGLWYQPVRYEDRMHLAYAAADLVLARAGATTVAELAALGAPSILVPWPLATEDHQTANARVLADVGGAVLVPEAAFDATRMATEVDRLAADPAALVVMSRAARSVGRRDAAHQIAVLVERSAARTPARREQR